MSDRRPFQLHREDADAAGQRDVGRDVRQGIGAGKMDNANETGISVARLVLGHNQKESSARLDAGWESDKYEVQRDSR